MKYREYLFEIRLEEPLEDHWRDWFPDWELDHCNEDAELGTGGTILRGTVSDQSALFGILSTIRNLNLTLVSIQRYSVERS